MLETSFTVNYKESLTYDLPDVEDIENNAEWEILIEPFVGYNEFYPSFMETFFENRRLVFNPDGNITLANTPFFFKIILKEKGKGALSFPYYCKVYVVCPESECPAQSSTGTGGDGEDDGTTSGQDSDKKGEIELFKVKPVDPLGRTSVVFNKTKPVDFNLLEEDWMDIITSYMQLSDYNVNPENIPLKSLKAVSFDRVE